MKILVRRTGGYAGLSEDVATVDTARLDAVAARQIEQMVQSIGFFDLPATVLGSTIGADLFYYEITVTERDQQHTVGFYHDDDPETASLRRFVDTLIQLA